MNHIPFCLKELKVIALQVSGAAGPSGIDSMMMRRLCVSFGSKSEDLCNSLALVARRLCSSYVDPDSLSAFLSCRLALDKCPGVRPIALVKLVEESLLRQSCGSSEMILLTLALATRVAL